MLIISKKKKKNTDMTEKDILKMEIAKELGVWEQVEEEGWESLSNAICGKIGGIMSRRLREAR
ncbi:MAG: small, acid-soluble spore protein, alpha/beta type [Syntrophomonas sp.]